MESFIRTWAMPNSNTFDCKPIGDLVQRYLKKSKISVDAFARNKRWADYTNDLNPNTTAEYHLDVLDFLQMLLDKNIKPDLIIFDPPYSPTQIKECYNGIGLEVGKNAQRNSWKKEKELINQLLIIGGHVLTFGWNSSGMGVNRPYRTLEIMLVCHGSGHNDTICKVEQKIA